MFIFRAGFYSSMCLKIILMLCLQIHVTFDPAGSYTVEGLKPDTLYKFSLAAHSEMGQGVFTHPIEARTAQSGELPLFYNHIFQVS